MTKTDANALGGKWRNSLLPDYLYSEWPIFSPLVIKL